MQTVIPVVLNRELSMTSRFSERSDIGINKTIRYYLHELYLATFITDRDARNRKMQQLIRLFNQKLKLRAH